MEKIFVLYEERESSQLCGIKGVWKSKDQAIQHMRELISKNNLYSSYSLVNLQEGYSESDPLYNEDLYSNYHVIDCSI
ncbi:hypothetical protein ACTNE3_01290 [Bacillota bacterium HCP3S3_F1_1]|jgi:hypothetical protein